MLRAVFLLALVYSASGFVPISFRPQTPTTAARSMLTVTMSPDTGANLNSSSDDDEVDFILSSTELDSAPVVEIDSSPPAPFAHAEKLVAVREKYRLSATDTGSPEFQVASMTERILYLTSHLQQNPKDFSTRRGLVALVNKRRRLLNYLFTEDVDRYQSLVKSLGIRHKAPGRVQSRAEKYAKFNSKKKS